MKRPDCYCLVTWHIEPGLVIPLRGLRGVVARRAAEAAFADVLEHMAPRARGAALTVIERDATGAVASRMTRTATRSWHSPKPASACSRCGGHGIDSAADAHCYRCGANGPRTRARHAAEDASQ